MPGYIQNKLQHHKHVHPRKPQYAPYPSAPRKYEAESQEPTPKDTAPPATKDEATHIKQVVGSILYYARVVYLTVIMAPFPPSLTIKGRQQKQHSKT